MRARGKEGKREEGRAKREARPVSGRPEMGPVSVGEGESRARLSDATLKGCNIHFLSLLLLLLLLKHNQLVT